MTLNGLPSTLKHETVWLDAYKYQDAERQYYEHNAQKTSTVSDPVIKQTKCQEGTPMSSIGIEIANAREKIIKMLSGDSPTVEQGNSHLLEKIKKMEEENKELSNNLSALTLKVQNLEGIMNRLTLFSDKISDPKNINSASTSKQNGTAGAAAAASFDEDDIDLFGSDEDDDEAQRVRNERLLAYASKKAQKPALVAKSSVVLDVKPWDDEVNMENLEQAVRKIVMDGLKWGASKLVPVAYGLQKLQIIAIVEDEKVSIDELQESIQEYDELVQSVDIAAFNKL